MEVFRAVADFRPPATEGEHNILSFSKGEQFEVFDNKKADWWGARRLNDDTIGYVPSRYLQYEERRIGKLLPNNYHEHRESQLKKFAAMQNSDQHKNPADEVPDIPAPDYDPDTPAAQRNSFVFVEKFRHVISNIHTIEELYTDFPEPYPDYQDEDSTDLPPPPPPISTDSNAATTPTSPSSTATPTIIGVGNGAVSSPEEEGDLIQPRKLVNPCVASRERQALHKELLLNYKLGKDVLQKPELNKILAKRKEAQKRKEWDERQANKRTSLELKLEERANKLKEKEDSELNTIEEDNNTPEFMQMHRRIIQKAPTSPTT